MCGEIFEYNGSAVVAMVGKNCFAIVGSVFSSRRLPPISRESPRSTTVSSSASLYQRLVFRHKLYQLREERDMKPETFASLVGGVGERFCCIWNTVRSVHHRGTCYATSRISAWLVLRRPP
ncbi:PREDICTED: proteasome subunit beta type-3-A-like isoform X2 [Brassica oleracea var. oleracea]|uniref:proteasome subunit beta type-3-A-like isoform X2 n=1 Tax=Brassica oleracea var. oleracea TaxID=109376 RepID=UPI0006A6A22D|nr:PREDICTED: proteasome subunit beta type-3-A-like isoform X2 [Brassica oleracea var. oleracea]